MLANQNDLRSAIVKEACVLLEKLSTVSGNYMAALMRDMLNVLLQLMANGNSVRDMGRAEARSIKSSAYRHRRTRAGRERNGSSGGMKCCIDT